MNRTLIFMDKKGQLTLVTFMSFHVKVETEKTTKYYLHDGNNGFFYKSLVQIRDNGWVLIGDL